MKAAASLLVGALNIVLMCITALSLFGAGPGLASWLPPLLFAMLFLATGWSLIDEGPRWLVRSAVVANVLCAILAMALAVYAVTAVETAGVALAGLFHFLNVWALEAATSPARRDHRAPTLRAGTGAFARLTAS